MDVPIGAAEESLRIRSALAAGGVLLSALVSYPFAALTGFSTLYSNDHTEALWNRPTVFKFF